MNELISIIVPIYNVEEYIKTCIKSLINQTYENIEIILVDDGSPDNCPQICDKFAKKDNRIKVFHKKNGGLSDARNYGIEKANGKYICFVDSDDFVTIDYIEFLYKGLVLNEADISICGFTNYFNEKKKVCKIKKINNKIYNKIDAHIYLNVLGYFDVASWNKLYKKELFRSVKFPVGKTCEDWRIMYKIIDKAEKIYYDSSVKYYYRKRENSITSSNNIRLDAIEAALSAIEFYKKKEYIKVLPYAYQSLMVSCLGTLNHMISNNNYLYLKKIMNIVKENRKFVSLKKIKFVKKIQLFIFMYAINFYIKLFRLLKSTKILK